MVTGSIESAFHIRRSMRTTFPSLELKPMTTTSPERAARLNSVRWWPSTHSRCADGVHLGVVSGIAYKRCDAISISSIRLGFPHKHRLSCGHRRARSAGSLHTCLRWSARAGNLTATPFFLMRRCAAERAMRSARVTISVSPANPSRGAGGLPFPARLSELGHRWRFPPVEIRRDTYRCPRQSLASSLANSPYDLDRTTSRWSLDPGILAGRRHRSHSDQR